MAWSLVNYHFDARYAKSPPWRELAQAILADARPGDLVIYNYPDPSLPYQIGDGLPVLLLPAQGPGDPAVAKPLDPASVEPELNRVAAQYERAWFVPQMTLNWDRDGEVSRMLSRGADRDYEAKFGPLHLRRYLLPNAYRRAWTALDAAFDDGISLRAYRATAARDQVQLTLYWQPTATPRKDYTVFAHVLDASGVLVAQQDNPPVEGTYPTTQWAAGAVVVDRYVIIMPAVLPPGDLRFEVGMYDKDGTRLRASADDKVIFGAFRP
jgi:hypothetical protein